MNEKQKLFPKVWRTLKYKTEYTHTHCIDIIFMGYSGVFFDAITGGNSYWVKFTCKVTWPMQRYLISFCKKFSSEYNLDFNIGQTEHDIKMGA